MKTRRGGLSVTRLVTTYVVFSLTWIFASDYFVFRFLESEESFWLGQVAKGSAFVLASGALIAFLYARSLAQVERSRADEQQQRELAERWSRRLEVAVEAAGIGIWEYHFATNELIWNRRMHALYGLAPDAFGRTLDDWRRCLHPEDRADAERALEAVLAAGQPWSRIEFRIVKADTGEVRSLLGFGKVSFDTAGKPAILTGADLDLTELKETQALLSQSRRLDAVGQLTGGIAHDFNNRLTVVLSALESLASAGLGDPELRAQVVSAQEAATRAAELTAQLLSFSRRQVLAPSTTDVGALLRRMEPMLRRTLPATIDVRLELAPDGWPCQVDRLQLESAVLNLAVNARDAMAAGGQLVLATANRTVEASLSGDGNGPAPGDYGCLSVRDTGCGMAPEVLDRVFEPFFTTKPVGEGSGLGLSMIHGFMKQSGGHVAIRSTPGEGTVVELLLPRAARAMPPVQTGLDTDSAVRGGHEHVLVVEDDEHVRRQLRLQLERLGYRVTVAADGEEGLAMLEGADDVDLLLTDVVLPGRLSGPDLAVEVRSRRAGLPVLFTSGYTERREHPAVTLEPGVNLLPKPFRRADLARLVRQRLDQGPDQRPDG